MKTIKGYKGFDKNMKCRDFQFKEGETYSHDGDVKACSKGFHFCENPLDILNYYPLQNGNVYHEVEGSGKINKEKDSDTKVAAQNIKIGVRLELPALIRASIDFIWSRASKGSIFKKSNATSGNRANSATSGDDAHSATSGDYANSATSGNRANSATSGYGAHSATSGNDAIACSIGRKAKAKATLGCFIVLAEWKEGATLTDAKPITVKAEIVDGEKIKAETWYKLVNGEFIETDDSNE